MPVAPVAEQNGEDAVEEEKMEAVHCDGHYMGSISHEWDTALVSLTG